MNGKLCCLETSNSTHSGSWRQFPSKSVKCSKSWLRIHLSGGPGHAVRCARQVFEQSRKFRLSICFGVEQKVITTFRCTRNGMERTLPPYTTDKFNEQIVVFRCNKLHKRTRLVLSPCNYFDDSKTDWNTCKHGQPMFDNHNSNNNGRSESLNFHIKFFVIY